MSRRDPLANAIPGLFRGAPAHLGVRALGVISTDADGHALMTCGVADGVTSVRPRRDIQGRVTVFDTLIRVAELSESTSATPGCVLSLPISGAADSTSLLVFTAGPVPNGDQSAELQDMADRAANVLHAGEPMDAELGRLRKDAAIDRGLPQLVNERGARQLAAAVLRLCRDGMPVRDCLDRDCRASRR